MKSPKPIDPVEWAKSIDLRSLRPHRRNKFLLYPDAFRRRDETGVIVSDAILVRKPEASDNLDARTAAILYVAKKAKAANLIRELSEVSNEEAARKVWGSAYFENIDTAAIVARCAYDADLPDDASQLPPLYMRLDMLLEEYDFDEITAVFERMGQIKILSAPDLRELDDATFWALADIIGERADLSPLAGTPADTLRAFIVRACMESMNGRRATSSTTSSSTSTQESSDEMSSA